MISSLPGNRLARFAQAIQDNGADAYFAWSPINMGYLHGVHEGAHERFSTLAFKASGEVALICPSLAATQAKRAGVDDVRGWMDGQDPLALFGQLADEWNLRAGICLVDDEMPAAMVLKMQEVLPAALFKPGQHVLSELMRIKEERELEAMRKAGSIADAAYPAALRAIRPGLTERELAKILKDEMARLGGIPTFSIVGTGENGAEPHHMTDDTPLKEGDVVLMDFGCEIDGYQADITRVAACGTPSDEARKVYKVVYDGHMAARKAIRPGVTPEEVDRAAREVITNAGYGEFFIHRTGHGIGLRGHEDPYIVLGNQRPLQVGECFSIEPGIYLPGKFGVRIENIVTVTETGHESFNEDPAPELVSAV